MKLRRKKYKYGTLLTDEEIVVDEHNVLIDGYTTYLVLLEKGYTDNIFVKVSNVSNIGNSYKFTPTTYVYGKHSPDGQEFVWRVPNKYKNKEIDIKIGNSVIVNTKFGKAEVTVTKVETLDKSPIQCKIRELVAW